LNILKLSTTKENYPVYGSYINSEDGQVTSSDGDSFIFLNAIFPFEGYINLFLLENILKKSSEDLSMEQVDQELKVKFGNTDTTLNLASELGSPFFSFPDEIDKVSLTEEILDNLKTAISFVGGELPYRSVYFGNGIICATNQERVFIYENKSITNPPIMLNKKIISFLTEAIEVGTKDNNIVLSWGEMEDISGGYGLFATDLISGFSIDAIQKFVTESKENTKLLCNFAVIKDALEKTKIMYVGESNPTLVIENKDKKLKMTGGSYANGFMDVEYDSDLEEEFTIEMSFDVFTSISIDYDVYIPLESNPDKLILDNGQSDIILMGVD